MTEQSRRILVVEDSRTQAQDMRIVLEKAGYSVSIASDGESGLELFHSWKPHLVLLDVILPGIDGFEVLREIKRDQENTFTPVIMLTVRADLDSTVAGLDSGADVYLPKPVEQPMLLAWIRATLRIKELEERVRERSLTDALTGVHTREYLAERLNGELAHAVRHGLHLGCVMIDVDYFKKINDTYGHQFGDHVLRKIAELARTTMRRGSIIGRYGGDEFVLILPFASCSNAVLMSERFRRAVEGAVFTDGRREAHVTVSCGAASYPEDAEEASDDALLRVADAALYKAKERGRNRTETPSSSPG